MIIRICLFIFVFSSICLSQSETLTKNERLIKGAEILKKAREAAGFNSDIKSIRINSIKAEQKSDKTYDYSVFISLPNKVRFISSSKLERMTFQHTDIWNTEKYRRWSESEILGRRIIRDTTENKTDKRFVDLIDKKNKKNFEKMMAISPERIFRLSLWMNVFPFILSHPIENEIKFEYVGKAKTNKLIVNVIETTTKSGRNIRLFFDSEKNLLLLMTIKYKSFDGRYEKKYFYSEYKLKNEIKMPTKVKIESKYIPTGKPPRISYSYLDVLKFEANPKLKPDLFKVD